MRLEQSTAPTIEPVTLAETKNFCRIDENRDDALVDGLIEAARVYVETKTGRQLIDATWKLYLPDFPSIIRLPRPPLDSITSITYVDSDGVTQTESATIYTADTKSEPAIVHEAYGQSWSTHRGDEDDSVIITYKAGYGSAVTDVPKALRIGVMMLVNHWYDNRQVVVTGSSNRATEAVDALLSLYTVGWVW